MNLFELYEERREAIKEYKIGDIFKCKWNNYQALITSIDIAKDLVNCIVCGIDQFSRYSNDLIYFDYSFHISYFKKHFSPLSNKTPKD